MARGDTPPPPLGWVDVMERGDTLSDDITGKGVAFGA